MQQLHEGLTGKRRIVGWFHYDGTTGGHGRSHLMNDEVQGVIEGADGDDHADGLSLGECHSVGAGRRALHRDDLARFGPNGLGRKSHAIDGADDFDGGIGERLAAFPGRLQREGLLLLDHQLGGALQYVHSFVDARPVTAIAVEGIRRCHCLLDRRFAGTLDGSYHAAVVRRCHLKHTHDAQPRCQPAIGHGCVSSPRRSLSSMFSR